MKVRTCKQLLSRIVYRLDRLDKLKSANVAEVIIKMEEDVTKDLIIQYKRQLGFLHRCLGVSFKFS